MLAREVRWGGRGGSLRDIPFLKKVRALPVASIACCDITMLQMVVTSRQSIVLNAESPW